MKYTELNDFYNFCDEDETLAEWLFETVMKNASWHLFENQEDIVYMINEDGRKYPELKEGAIDRIHEQIQQEMGWVSWSLAYIMADQYYRGIINAGDEAWRLKEEFGHDYPNWEDVYPDEIPFEEYEGKGKISSRPRYGFNGDYE